MAAVNLEQLEQKISTIKVRVEELHDIICGQDTTKPVTLNKWTERILIVIGSVLLTIFCMYMGKLILK